MPKRISDSTVSPLTRLERDVLGLAMIGLADADLATRVSAKRCIEEWFPRAKPEDWPHFSKRQLACLYAELELENAVYDPDLLFKVIAGLQAAADVSALAPLARVSSGPASSPNGKRARSAAADAIEAIRERLGLEKDRQTLLRSAEPPGEGGMLLRPAGNVPTADPDHLLRASDEPGSGS